MRAYDVVVLGGGVIGCATAMNLAKAGVSVAVIDKGSQVAEGATARSSACTRLHYSVQHNADIARHALQYFHNIKDELQDNEADAGYVQCGHMIVGGDDDLGAAMRRTVQSLAAQGFQTEMIDGDTASEIHPRLDLKGVAHIGWEPESGFADPYLTTSSFKRAAQNCGCEFFLGTEATGLLRRGTDVVGVQTASEGDFEAGMVVSALNIWTPQTLGTWLGMQLPMQLEKHHLIALRTDKGYRNEKAQRVQALPNVKCLMQESQPYFRAYDGGRSLLVGNNHPAHQELVHHADDWDEAVTLDQQIHCAQIAQSRFRGYENAEIVQSWSGVYDVSHDWQPVLGNIPGIDGLVVAFGFSGHGFKLSPIIGQMLAAQVLGVDLNLGGVDIRPYSITRFTEGAELQSQYHGAGS